MYRISRLLWQTSLKKCGIINQNYNLLRYIRSIAKRDVGPKWVNAKVKTLTKYDDSERTESYKDFIKSVRKSGLGDEYEIEKEFVKEDYHGDVIERCENFFEMHENEEKFLKSAIKKKIIGKKYFKLDRETNLLTHAAKEQIRFLHQSDPLNWNYKALSECFPISEEGVKKLVNCKFVLTCPEKIKAHDEKVAELWKILKSGKPTDLITPLTQKLYKEGKLVDDYFSGNSSLPTSPPSKIVVEIKKKKKLGEFAAIVKSNAEYENKKLLTDSKATTESQIALRNESYIKATNATKEDIKKIKQFKFETEETDDNKDPEVYRYRRKRETDDSEIPFSQFKEILKDETTAAMKHKPKNEYDEFVLKETSKIESQSPPVSQQPLEDYSPNTPKYDKNKTIDIMYEKTKSGTSLYKFDDKLGYQYPLGKNIKSKIRLRPSQYRNGKVYKVGQSVYDDDGEFLYRVPTLSKSN